MEKINTIDLLNNKVETENGTSFYHDTVNIQEDGVLHLGSFDFGPDVDRLWGHDYEYDIYVEKEWKDTILLLLLQEHFKTTSEFEKWIDNKAIPSTTSLW